MGVSFTGLKTRSIGIGCALPLFVAYSLCVCLHLTSSFVPHSRIGCSHCFCLRDCPGLFLPVLLFLSFLLVALLFRFFNEIKNFIHAHLVDLCVSAISLRLGVLHHLLIDRVLVYRSALSHWSLTLSLSPLCLLVGVTGQAVDVVTAATTPAALVHFVFVTRSIRPRLVAHMLVLVHTILVVVISPTVFHISRAVMAVLSMLFSLSAFRMLASWRTLLMGCCCPIHWLADWWVIFGRLSTLLSCLLLSDNSLFLQSLGFARCVVQVDLSFVLFAEPSVWFR